MTTAKQREAPDQPVKRSGSPVALGALGDVAFDADAIGNTQLVVEVRRQPAPREVMVDVEPRSVHQTL